VSTKDLEAKLGKEAVKIGLGPNMKNKWARNDKATSMVQVFPSFLSSLFSNSTSHLQVARIVDPASVQDSVLLQMQGLQKSPRGDGLNKKDIDALAKVGGPTPVCS